jgi:hypothetical protein
VFSAWSISALADPLNDGLIAQERGDYPAAFKDFMHSTKNGSPAAAYGLATLYLQGRGIQQDFGRAMFWYEVAASCGNSTAQGAIGEMFMDGEGVPQNYATAASYFLAGANDGDPTSQFSAGRAYFLGQGVPQDFVTSYMWFSLSAAASTNQDTSKQAVAERDSLMKLMTQDQIAQGQAAALAWQPAYLRQPPSNERGVSIYVPGQGWVCPRAEMAAQAGTQK